MNTPDTLIIGGGLSGLSAAVELCSQGKNVLLLEQHQYGGGRTFSFIDAATGDETDNGQHLMMGCYQATRQFLHRIGTEHQTLLQPGLEIQFLHPSRQPYKFICPRVPAPFHLLGGVLKFNAIPWAHRMRMIAMAKELRSVAPSEEQVLDCLTAKEWLSSSGQSDVTREFFWDMITIGALNNHPDKVSALMLFRVLREVFSGKRENSSFLFPQAGLSSVFVNPAIEYIRRNGGTVLLNKEVVQLHMDGEHIRSISTENGTEYRANTYISAVPWFALDRILTRSKIAPAQVIKTSSGETYDPAMFTASPIISFHLWFDTQIFDGDFAALIGTRVQWIFNKEKQTTMFPDSHRPRKQKKHGQKRQHLSLVISGAENYLEMRKEELVSLVMEDLAQVLPGVKNAVLLHSMVIKEKRATFIPAPGLESQRPCPETNCSNLFLAGDWTNTGFPATIEGAILSGKKAAERTQTYKEASDR